MGVIHSCKRLAVPAAAACLWLSGLAPVQAAGDTLDQSQTLATGANTLRTPMAQTFTAGSSGSLDRVSLMIATSYGALTVNVQIQGVSNGEPNGSVLGSGSFTGTVFCCHNWQDVMFSPAVSVASGTQYAIVVSPSGNLTWYDSYSFDAYPKGQMWLWSNGSWIYSTSFGKDFCFKTWMLSGGSANQAPAITAASSVLSATEGSTAANSGTYSDPDGDNVALTATAGTLTKSGTSSGAWSWSLPGADESPVQTVTVTATDGRGGTASVSFTVSFVPVPPTVSITGAPASGPEGTPITLTGKASSASAADNAVGFTLTWTITKNGNPFATASGPSVTFTPDDEGSFVANLRATDDGGNSATAMVTIAGANVAPTATITSVTHDMLVLVPFQPVTVTAGFSDPGALDTHTASIDYGDGTPADTTTYGASGSGDTSDSHAYAAPGTYTITYTVTDDDGGSGAATAKVTVETPDQALGVIASYVQSMASLNKGEKNGLLAKYNAAIDSLARGDTNAACNQLGAVLNDLTALTNNGRLSPTDSAALSSSTWTVHRALGCTRVKLGWLTLNL